MSRAAGPASPAPVPRVPLLPDVASLMVVAGLPGAGKTTLVRRLAADSAVLALDAEDVAGRLGRVPAPYRLLRPAVHACHLARVMLALPSAAACVLTSDPLTSRWRLALFAAAAVVTRRRLVVVVIEADPEEARDGQRRRGRSLPRRRMARHVAEHEALRRDRYTGVADLVLTREQAARAVPSPSDPVPPCAHEAATSTSDASQSRFSRSSSKAWGAGSATRSIST